MEKILSRITESRPEGVLEKSYMEMRMKILETLSLVIAINDFEKDQEELLDFANSEIIPLGNPYQELFFKRPEDLLKLNIVNYTPVNGRVMTEYGDFVREVVSLMQSHKESVIPSVELLSVIITAAGLRYIQPELHSSLGGTNTMGKTIKKNPQNVAKPSKAELQEMLGQQRAAKVQEIALAKEKAAKARAEEKAKMEANSDAMDKGIEAAGGVVAEVVDDLDNGAIITPSTKIDGVSINDICLEAVDELTGRDKLIKEEKDMSEVIKRKTLKEYLEENEAFMEEYRRRGEEIHNYIDNFSKIIRAEAKEIGLSLDDDVKSSQPNFEKEENVAKEIATCNFQELVVKPKSGIFKKVLVGAAILGIAVVGGKTLKGFLSKEDQSYAE